MVKKRDITEILSRYINELEKEDSIKGSDKLLRIVQTIYNKQLEYEETLAKLKGQNKEPIETSDPMFFSQRPQKQNTTSIQELSKSTDLDKLLNLSTALIIQRNKRK